MIAASPTIGQFGLLDKAEVKAHPDYNYYLAIHKLLSSHDGMRICREYLRQLGSQVSDGWQLHKVLRDAEHAMGLLKLVYLNDVIGGPGFLFQVGGKNALLDNGANIATKSAHRANTHRLQWWLVYKAAALNKLEGVQPSASKIGELYGTLGKGLKDVRIINGEGTFYLWDELVDQTEGNVKAPKSGKMKSFGYPEWFCGKWLHGKSDSASTTKEAYFQDYKRLNTAFLDLENLTKYQKIPTVD